jgi:PAS domain S-box-containing protein
MTTGPDSGGETDAEGTRALKIIASMPGFAWSADPEGRFTYISPRTLAYVGSTLHDVSISSDEDEFGWRWTVHPDDYERVVARWRHCLRTGEHYDTEHRLRRADGVYRWIRNSGRAERDSEGRITQWYGTTIEIEEQKQIEAQRRDRELELSQLVDMVPSHVWRLTPDGEPTFFNKRMVDFLGLNVTDTEKPGKTRLEVLIETVVHADDVGTLSATLHRSLITGERFSIDYRLRRVDGVYRWMSSHAEPMRDQAGHIVQWYGLCHDIDDQVTAQEALRRASEKLAQATQAASMGELAASIAHEVNQPLGAVVANSHACQRWLAAEPPNVERARRAAERIIGNAHDAADVVSRIRALFKQTAGARRRSMLGPVIGEATRLLADAALEHGVEIVASVDEGIPLVSFDRVQIQQVLINLMRNGLEAMETSEGARTLGVRVRASGGVVRVEVSDAGPGIEHPERIFESFFTTKEGGMGMGLAISRSIVEAHGGQLWVARNDRGGSTFIFTLPGEPANPGAS